jgi:uncharacterized protein (TIRG00374 family)
MRKATAPIVILVIALTFVFFQRDVLRDIWQRLIGLPPFALLPLVLAGAVLVVARGYFLAACSPGVTLRQAVMTDQAALAAGYGIIVGGGVVGTGMRIRMFNSWGIGHITIASSIIATAVVPSFTTWGLPSVLLIIPAIRGTATFEEKLAVSVGVPLIVFSVAFWWLALRVPFLFSAVGRGTNRIRLYVLRKLPQRYVRIRHGVERTQPVSFSEEMRVGLVHLLRNRWKSILMASLTTQIAGFLCLWVSAEVFQVQGLSIPEALVAFSLVRVVVALSPIPGGVGLAEVGLVVLLKGAGVNEIDAVGATVLYRFLTWFLPIIVGSFTWWKYTRSVYPLSEGGSVLFDGE